ncbi:MAG: hypothetical protein IJP44_06155 [Bacteroidales bacterium]|nr:hypothetical protein [Bacteroidales bacterium]
MKTKSLLLIVALFAGTILLCNSCKKSGSSNSTSNSTLIGTWIQTGGYNHTPEHPDRWTFKSNNMGTKEGYMYTGQYEVYSEKPWSYDESSRTLVFGHIYFVQTLSSSMLVLIDDEGDNYSFRKQ